MKAIILAGGFAKRLWPLTKEQAKPLVDLNGRPIIHYIISSLDKSQEISEIIISTNEKFSDSFYKWLATQTFSKPIKIIAEPVMDEKNKLGAIGGLNFVFESQNISGDVFVIAGDNLTGVNIDAMLNESKKTGDTVIGVYDIKNFAAAKKFGEVKIDSEKKIISFREKPEFPETTMISTGCYVFPKGIRNEIKQYLSELKNKDAPGHFIAWLAGKASVYAYVFDTYWFDIGDHETLEKAREFAKNHLN